MPSGFRGPMKMQEMCSDEGADDRFRCAVMWEPFGIQVCSDVGAVRDSGVQ